MLVPVHESDASFSAIRDAPRLAPLIWRNCRQTSIRADRRWRRRDVSSCPAPHNSSRRPCWTPAPYRVCAASGCPVYSCRPAQLITPHSCTPAQLVTPHSCSTAQLVTPRRRASNVPTTCAPPPPSATGSTPLSGTFTSLTASASVHHHVALFSGASMSAFGLLCQPAALCSCCFLYISQLLN